MRASRIIAGGLGALAIGGAFFVLRSKPALPEYGPSLVIAVDHPASAAELEKSIAEPIEEAASKLARIERVRSETGNGRVRVTCRFEKGVTPDDAAERTQNAIQGILRQLPKEAPPPLVQRAADSRVVYFAHDKPLDNIEAIQGVAQVTTCGERKDRVHVTLDFKTAAAKSVDVADVFAAFSTRPGAARNLPLEEIEATRVGNGGALLRDVAKVERRLAEPACIGVLADRPTHFVSRVRLQAATEQKTKKTLIEIGGELRKASALFFDEDTTARVAIRLPAVKEQRRGTAEKVAAALKQTKGQPLAVVFADAEEAEAVVSLAPGASDPPDVEKLRAAVRSVPDVADRGLVHSPQGIPPRVAVIADDEATAREADKAVLASGPAVLVHDLPAPEPVVDVKVDVPRAKHEGLDVAEVARTARMILDGVDMSLFFFATSPAGLEGIEAANLHGHPLAPLVKITKGTETTLVRVNRKRAFERVWEVAGTSQRDTIAKALAGKPLKVELLPPP